MDSHAYSIRIAKPGDEAGIAAVHVQSWQETYRGLIPQSYLDSLSIEKRQKMWQGVIARNGDTDARGILLVAEDAEGSIVGFASSGTEREPGSGSDSELYAIYLLKRAQGCGTGRALFERTIQALWARGFRTMRLWVLETNPTRKFYEAFSGRKGLETKFVDMGGAALREVSYRFDLNRQIDIRELSDDEYQEHFKQWGPIIFDRN